MAAVAIAEDEVRRVASRARFARMLALTNQALEVDRMRLPPLNLPIDAVTFDQFVDTDQDRAKGKEPSARPTSSTSSPTGGRIRSTEGNSYILRHARPSVLGYFRPRETQRAAAGHYLTP